MRRIALVISLIALLVGVGTFAGLAAAQPAPTATPTPTPPPTLMPTPSPAPGIEVYIQALDAEASEIGPDPGRFHVYTVLPPGFFADGWLKVYYTIEGTAQNGVDYEQIQDCVYALVGYPIVPPPTDAPAEYVDINPIPDNIVEGDETVILVLSNGRSAQVIINDGPTVTPTPTPTRTPLVSLAPPTPTPLPTPTPTPTQPPIPGQAVLTISPTSGPLGTVVTLYGSGFCAGDYIPAGHITIAGSARNPAPIQVSAAGDWTATLMIPTMLPNGTQQVVATSYGGSQVCYLAGRTWFTVTPPCECVPLGFHAHYAFRKINSGDLKDTGVDVSLPQPPCPQGWEVIQILVKHSPTPVPTPTATPTRTFPPMPTPWYTLPSIPPYNPPP